MTRVLSRLPRWATLLAINALSGCALGLAIQSRYAILLVVVYSVVGGYLYDRVWRRMLASVDAVAGDLDSVQVSTTASVGSMIEADRAICNRLALAESRLAALEARRPGPSVVGSLSKRPS